MTEEVKEDEEEKVCWPCKAFDRQLLVSMHAHISMHWRSRLHKFQQTRPT